MTRAMDRHRVGEVIAELGTPSGQADPYPLYRRLRLVAAGGGIHRCLGAALARLEAQVALPAFLRGLPRLALSGTPVPRDGLTLHGYASVPISAD